MVASVPELTSLSFWTEGMAVIISWANSFSASVGAPKLVPLRRAVSMAMVYERMGVSENHGAPGEDIIEIAVAVDVEKAGPIAAFKEDWFAAHAAEGSGRAVDPAGHELFCACKGEMAFFA